MTRADGVGRLAGKATIITGAAKGIGRATARVFAREGARLLLADVDEPGLEAVTAELAGTGTIGLAVDVSREPDVERMVARAVEAFDRLDVLVANAGIIPLTALDRTSVEEWDHVMAVDGRGMFLSCKHAVAAMLTTGGGAIVCLSSISGMAGQPQPTPENPHSTTAIFRGARDSRRRTARPSSSRRASPSTWPWSGRSAAPGSTPWPRARSAPRR